VISADIATRLNAQINREFYSAYFYLALSAQAEAGSLKGTAAWFAAKHREEMTHALKMHRYVLDQGAAVDHFLEQRLGFGNELVVRDAPFGFRAQVLRGDGLPGHDGQRWVARRAGGRGFPALAQQADCGTAEG